jgi:hypothetical protein
MYTCSKCKFSSSGPGRCWRCGGTLEEQPSPSQVLHLTLRQPRRLLFLGAIDGRPELDFIRFLRPDIYTAHITTYGDAADELQELHMTTFGSTLITVDEHVDATRLEDFYPPNSFDMVAWIGPTNDQHLDQTTQLVGAFVRSAGLVVTDGGLVCVVQDLKTPNFRDILGLPGAFFCGLITLPGRTQTQHSSKKKELSDRTDQLVAFTFRHGLVQNLNDIQNRRFIQLLTDHIMKQPAGLFKPDPRVKEHNILSKQQLADRIFEFAGIGIERPPQVRFTIVPPAEPRRISMYKCPACRDFASTGSGNCWKCGAHLAPEYE